MTAANIVWTKRASKRLRDIVVYIATNFYPDYALAFRDDALDTANALADNPEIGEEAFPTLKRPTYRKILCHNRHYWIYYRILKNKIEIMSVKHTLQRVDALHDL